ncbi:MAG: TVP38/TMEM64 family protein [Clostridia bacterium]|nr:TVP38/TMEM64 family protein [Clostridia bacterium]
MKNRVKAKIQHLTPKQKKCFGALSVLIFLTFVVLVTFFIGRPMLRFVSEPEQFRTWVDGHGIWGRLIFLGMVIFQVIFAVIPGEPLEIGAGYAFGAVEGTLLCLLGTTLGGILVFMLVRKLGVRLVEVFFPIERIRSLWFLRTEKRRNFLTFLLFFIPGTPKDLLCYFVGLTDMKLSTWIWITAVARIPSVITSTIGGDALGEERYLLAIIAFAVTAAVSVAGILIYQKIIKPRRQKHREHTK